MKINLMCFHISPLYPLNWKIAVRLRQTNLVLNATFKARPDYLIKTK